MAAKRRKKLTDLEKVLMGRPLPKRLRKAFNGKQK